MRMRDCGAAEEPVILAKTLFELSRNPDNMSEHFDPAVHTLEAIATGLPGHRPIVCRSCDDTDLPSEHLDRKLGIPTFRNAWEDNGTTVRVNMRRARVIHMDRIREARDQELLKQDVAFMRAVESGDTSSQSAIAREKQRLRDIPQTFDLSNATTPADLSSSWPVNLAIA